MRAVNLYYLAGISNERLFSDYENILSARNGVTRIRRADQTALRSLLKMLTPGTASPGSAARIRLRCALF